MNTQARNHPKKDSVINIEPIKSVDDIHKIKNLLKDHPRNYALFCLGINTNLRAGDLLSLKNSNISWETSEIRLRESKTKKTRHILLAPQMLASLELIRDRDNPESFLFKSEKTGGKLDISSLNAMMKLWCLRVGIKGNFGSHTLRKTWSYLQYKVFGEDLALVSKELNHASMQTTYRYIGIMPDDVKRMYLREI